MKTKHIGFAIVSLLLVCAIAVNLTGCSTKIQAESLMDDVTPNTVAVLDDLSPYNASITDFAVRLFQESEESGKNTLISPLSVLCALSMTANGAEGKTLEQMESVLGLTADELNRYLYSYMHKLSQDDAKSLMLANSVWFNSSDRFTPNQDFLQTNADYYGADIYKAPFDEQTCRDINAWVEEKTDGMISELLDQIPAHALMYLVNALAFEAEWEYTYKQSQVRDGDFTKEDGAKQTVEFMHGDEDVYLEDELATGFMKFYKSGYAFVAMLPNEGVSVSEYVASLDGESLHALLENPQYSSVVTSVPKFETAYDVEMSQVLKAMGMSLAFDGDNAQLQGVGTSDAGNLYINRVLHKAHISVNEKGTKAGASTAIEIVDKGEMMEIKTVHLNRPFVYMLVDCNEQLPFFIGTMMSVE